MKINLDTDELKKLGRQADKVFLKPEAEKALVELLKARKEIEEAITEAKTVLEEAALKLNPNFSSLTADNVKIYYRSFGNRWGVDQTLLEYLPKDMYTTETKIKLDSKKVEKYIKDVGKIPAGVTEIERPKTITFSFKGEVEDE